MDNSSGHVLDLLFGRWRSQILYAGTELGVFESLNGATAKRSTRIAQELSLDPALLYRLLRALASLGLMTEGRDRTFELTQAGRLLTAEHPQTMRAMARLEEGPQHYALWTHLPAMVRDGRQNAFLREFGRMAFEHAKVDADYDRRFKEAMSSYSAVQTGWVLEALAGVDLSKVGSFCDVAGGHGYMMASLVRAYPQMTGTVLDLPEVVNDGDQLVAAKFGVADRCRYIGGDMFKEIPAAEAYSLKMILHDWNDDECVQILSNIRRSASQKGRVFIVEHVVPGPDTPHFAKLFDIHMMCWGTGRERTEEEYEDLLRRAGWRASGRHYPSSRMMGIIEGALS